MKIFITGGTGVVYSITDDFPKTAKKFIYEEKLNFMKKDDENEV